MKTTIKKEPQSEQIHIMCSKKFRQMLGAHLEHFGRARNNRISEAHLVKQCVRYVALNVWGVPKAYLDEIDTLSVLVNANKSGNKASSKLCLTCGIDPAVMCNQCIRELAQSIHERYA